MEIIMQNNMNSNNSNKRIINHVKNKANKRCTACTYVGPSMLQHSSPATHRSNCKPTQATVFTVCTHVRPSTLQHSSPATHRSNCSV